MNLIPLVSAIVIFISCSHEQQPQEELTAVTAKTEKIAFINGPTLFRNIAEVELTKLEKQKLELIIQIEKGDEKSAKKLEDIQKEIETLNAFKKHMIFRLPRIPIPVPCMGGKELNCKIDLNGIKGISLSEGVSVAQIIIKDSKNNIVGQNSGIGEGINGQRVILLKSELKGSGTMYITIENKILGEKTFQVPVGNN